MIISRKKKRGISLSHHKKNSSPYCSPILHQSQVHAFNHDDEKLNYERKRSVLESPRGSNSNIPRIIFTYKTNGTDSYPEFSQNCQNSQYRNTSNNVLQYPYSDNKSTWKPKSTIASRNNAQQSSHSNQQQNNKSLNKIPYKDGAYITQAKLFDDLALTTSLLQQRPLLYKQKIDYSALPYAQAVNLRRKRLELRRDVVNLSYQNQLDSKIKVAKQTVKETQSAIKNEKVTKMVASNPKAQSKPRQAYAEKRNANNLLQMEKKLKEIIFICDQNLK